MAQWQQEHEAKRRIEALIFEHRCELEDDGLAPDEIDRRCVQFRAELKTTAAPPPAVVDEVSQPLPSLLEQLLSPDDRGAVEARERPVGLEDGSTLPNQVAELLRRGYSDADVRKVLGGNSMRVWRAVEAAATE